MIGIARLTLAFVLMVAGTIQGEGGVDLETLGPPLAAVVMNRAAIGKDFGGWHGYAAPSERAVEIAWAAWKAGSTEGGPLHALSKADMEKLGFDKGEWTEYCTDDGRWCIYTGRWP